MLYGWNTLNANVWLPSLSELVGIDPNQYWDGNGCYFSAMQGLNTSADYYVDAQGGNQFAYFKQYNTSGGMEKIWAACNQQVFWFRSPVFGDTYRANEWINLSGTLHMPVTAYQAVHPAVLYDPKQMFENDVRLWYTETDRGDGMEYIPAKTIVTRTKGTAWFGSSYNMNVYKGCCHGCIYCDSRSECYGVEDFDRVRAKKDALEIIRNDLRRKVKTGIVSTGAMSDPYNPFERELMLTRHALELLDAYGFGVAIATKSDLITRDIDVLAQIQEHSPVLCKVTVTTCDDALAAKLEPHAPPPSKRFAAIRKLADAGLFAGILLMPALPFLEDTRENVLDIVEQAHASGARFIYAAFGMTLRANQRDWYYAQLEKLFPGERLPDRYRRQYGSAYQCVSPHACELWGVFSAACRKAGILYDMQEIIRASQAGYGSTQLSFLD